MKRILAIVIAITVMGTVFSGCGKVKGSKKDDDNDIVVSEAKSDNDSKDETTQGDDVSDSSMNNVDSSADSDNASSYGYEDVIRAYFDANNEGDVEKSIRTMYPDKAVDGMFKLSELQGADIEKELGGNKTNYVITDIVEEGPMTEKEIEPFMILFDQMAGAFDKIEEYGGDVQALSDEQREELYNLFMGYTDPEEDDIDRIYHAAEGYDVTVYYTNDGEPDEDYFYVYNVEGEGWKINNSMRKFAKKAKNAASNSTAKTVHTSFAVALTDLDYDGTDVSGVYIIGSDDSMNYNVPSTINVSEIRNTVGSEYDTISKYDYFAIIVNGECSYVAVCKKDDDNIGMYPISNIPKALNGDKLETEEVSKIDNYTLDELFEISKDIIE